MSVAGDPITGGMKRPVEWSRSKVDVSALSRLVVDALGGKERDG